MTVAPSSMGVLRLPNGLGGQCLACSRTFTSFGSCKRHFQLVHLEEKMVECHICKKLYKGDLSLRQHLRTHHGIYQTMMKELSCPQQQNF